MRIASYVMMLALAARALAQEAPTFSTNVKVVSVLATVQDRDGKIVRNLTQDDFVLQEDGVPQTIRYFSQESGLPLTVGILVDTSRSQIGVLEAERRASYTFLDQVLREDKDLAFINHFDVTVSTLQGLTSSRKELASALELLRVPDEIATLPYSAVRDCSDGIMRKQSGRKAFILLTDGVAYRDSTSIGTAIEFAQRADTILFSIRYSDPIPKYRPIRGAILAAAKERGKDGLLRMARETGGASYEVTKTETIESIYSRIEDSLRSQYSIGYTPQKPLSDGKYRKIKLATKDRRLVVSTRDGYYAN